MFFYPPYRVHVFMVSRTVKTDVRNVHGTCIILLKSQWHTATEIKSVKKIYSYVKCLDKIINK